MRFDHARARPARQPLCAGSFCRSGAPWPSSRPPGAHLAGTAVATTTHMHTQSIALFAALAVLLGVMEPQEQTRRIVLSPELAALDRELGAVFAQIERRIHERGLTISDLEAVAGDAEAERDMLGMTTAEYLAVQNQIADILTRAQRLMPNPPTGPLLPLQQDSRGGGEQICTTDTTVEELEDGTIVITDHISHTCEQIFTGPEPDWPVDEPETGPDRGPGSMFTPFEQDCHDAGGVVEGGSCECAQSRGCIAAILGATVTLPACVSVLYCAAPVGLWVAAWYLCEQRPCDAVNRHHGAP